MVSVKKTADFEVSGDGRAANWAAAEWINMRVQEPETETRVTKAKILYSDLGMYFLFDCQDQKVTSTIREDFGSLFKEDAVEVFLWPDQSVPVYIEYELSPLDYELILLVPNIGGRFQGWTPWHYEGDQKVKHATSVKGGEKQSNAQIKSWVAEFFIPYNVMKPLAQSPPAAGTKWRANLYRLDYDKGYTSWTWQRTTPKTRGSFHQFNKFGTLIFE